MMQKMQFYVDSFAEKKLISISKLKGEWKSRHATPHHMLINKKIPYFTFWLDTEIITILVIFRDGHC